MKKAICVSLILIAALLSGCSSKNEMKDGFIRQKCPTIPLAGKNIFVSW